MSDDEGRLFPAMRAALGEEAFASALAEGHSLPLEEAVALALDRGAAAG